jgi:hypothetical protein
MEAPPACGPQSRRHSTLGNFGPGDYEFAHAAVCSHALSNASARAGQAQSTPHRTRSDPALSSSDGAPLPGPSGYGRSSVRTCLGRPVVWKTLCDGLGVMLAWPSSTATMSRLSPLGADVAACIAVVSLHTGCMAMAIAALLAADSAGGTTAPPRLLVIAIGLVVVAVGAAQIKFRRPVTLALNRLYAQLPGKWQYPRWWLPAVGAFFVLGGALTLALGLAVGR